MKKVILSCLIAAGLTACSSVGHKYEVIYDNWKNEMIEVNNAHGEALVILKSFKEKINHHKAEINEFANYIVNVQAEADLLSRQGKDIELAELEKQIIKNSQSNAKKHQHFMVFLNNLAKLQSNLENEVVVIEESSTEALPVFKSYKQALAYWVTEMTVINQGHNQALVAINDLQNHIEQHENHIAEFGFRITQDKKLADQAVDKKQDLIALEQNIKQNYQNNHKKHQKFVTFLKHLRKVKTQFEG